MTNQERTDMYVKAIKREQTSRTALGRAVTVIGNAEGKYDPNAITAEETARRVLEDRDNGLCPSEEAKWNDRIRKAYRT